MGENKVERMQALPAHLAYMGWCNLSYITPVSALELRKRPGEFEFRMVATDTFESLAEADADGCAVHVPPAPPHSAC